MIFWLTLNLKLLLCASNFDVSSIYSGNVAQNGDLIDRFIVVYEVYKCSNNDNYSLIRGYLHNDMENLGEFKKKVIFEFDKYISDKEKWSKNKKGKIEKPIQSAHHFSFCWRMSRTKDFMNKIKKTFKKYLKELKASEDEITFERVKRFLSKRDLRSETSSLRSFDTDLEDDIDVEQTPIPSRKKSLANDIVSDKYSSKKDLRRSQIKTELTSSTETLKDCSGRSKYTKVLKEAKVEPNHSNFSLRNEFEQGNNILVEKKGSTSQFYTLQSKSKDKTSDLTKEFNSKSSSQTLQSENFKQELPKPKLSLKKSEPRKNSSSEDSDSSYDSKPSKSASNDRKKYRIPDFPQNRSQSIDDNSSDTELISIPNIKYPNQTAQNSSWRKEILISDNNEHQIPPAPPFNHKALTLSLPINNSTMTGEEKPKHYERQQEVISELREKFAADRKKKLRKKRAL